jgi:hypothetical protein
MTDAPVQLLLYSFGADARFEGRLVGALERMESGGALRILEALFVRNDPETGELAAVDLRSRGAGSMVLPLVGFRLDPAERSRTTERALDAEGLGETLAALGAELAPGAAMAAVLVEHTWSRALEDAVAQSGGAPLSDEFVDAASLAELTQKLLAAGRSGPGGAADQPRGRSAR